MVNYRWTYEASGVLKETNRPAIHVEVARSHVVPISPGGNQPNEPETLQSVLDGVLGQIQYPAGDNVNTVVAKVAESVGSTVSKVGGRIDYCRAYVGTVRVVWAPEEAKP